MDVTDAVSIIGPGMTVLLDTIEAGLRTPVARKLVMPGNQVVWDDCCEGQLAVRVVSLVGSTAMAKPAMQPCAPLWQVRAGISVMRCAHVVNDQGNAPTAAQMTADAFTTYRDFEDIVQALSCDFAANEWVFTLRIEQWLPTPVEGGCMGGEVTATFQMSLCQPC